MNNREDDLSLQSQEEKIKKNSSKSKKKKITIATTTTILVATAIVVPTVLYVANGKFDIEINTNVDIVEEYTTNVKRGMLVKDIKAQQIEGYTFVGFYKDADLTQPYGENDKVSKNMQIYAKYEINIYSLKFPTSPAFTIDGEAIEGNQVNIEYNTEYQFKINLNAGYTESEITVKANGEIIEADTNGYYTLTVKDDIVIEVEGVAINTYTITFYDETGETIYKIEEVAYNQDSTYKEIPTKHSTPTYNYTFAGWVDKEGEPVDLTNIIVDKDVYASFTEEYIEYRINKIPSQVVIKDSEGIELTGSNTLHYGDRIEITYNETIGHEMTKFEVMGATREGETNFYTVIGDLTVIYEEEIQTFTVTIEVNNAEYGSLNIYSVTVPYGTTYETDGNILTFNDKTNVIAMPFEDTAQYEYTFTGWSSNSGTITAEETITANFNRVTNSYTVTFYDENKTTVLDTLTDEYGTSIEYSGEEPTKPADNTYTYTFECWETIDGEEYELSGKTITSDLALYARYSATYIEYDIADIPAQVEIRKGGKNLTSDDTLHYGDRIEITYYVSVGYKMTRFEVRGATREGETNFYTVSGDLTVIYEEVIQTFTIQWMNYDGSVLETDIIEYGSIPEYNGATPVRESTDDYIYTFAGWDPVITEAKEDISYIAQYKQDEILHFTIENGKITEYFGTDKDIIIPTTYSIASDGTIIVGNNHKVTSVGDEAFYNNSLTSITIPASVTSLGYRAFSGCSSLETVIFISGSQLESIGNYAFNKCSSITSITIPASVTNLGMLAFSNCTGLKTVTFEENSQLNYIGMQAFTVCTNLTSINIPESVTSIGNYAFDNCSNLANVYYEGTVNEWVSITFGNDAANPLYYGANLYINDDELVTEINIDTATKINSYVFYEYTNLTKVTIGSQVTSIGDSAFEGCTGLTEINYNAVNLADLSNNNRVFNYAGQDGAGIVFNIGADVTRIPAYLFYTYIYNTQAYITAVNFAENSQCKEIGNNAFTSTDITNITIPASVTRIGITAFVGCSELTEVIFENVYVWSVSETQGGAGTELSPTDLQNTSTAATYLADTYNAYYWTREDVEVLDFEINDSREITKYTGTDTEVVIPSTYSLLEDGTVIAGTDNTITGIADGGGTYPNYTGVFANSSIISITLPSTIEKIGVYAFYNSSNLANVYYEGTIDEWMEISFGSAYGPLSNGANLYVNGDELVTEVSIDSATRIKDEIFRGCTSIKKVTIGSQVTIIGNRAFRGCDNLANVYYEGTIEKWMEISFYADANPLYNGANLYVNGDELVTEVSIYSATIIKDHVFEGCESLTKVTIGSQVTNIEYNAFRGCSNLVTVIFEEGSQLESIGEYAFYNCSSLSSITIPASVTSIARNTFSGCSNLATVIIEKGSQLESIGSSTFYGCSSLTSITIPASVTSIGNLAFGYTFDLETVIIESNYAYKTATSTTACGNLLRYATVVRVLTSCIGTDTNSYLENTANFTKTTDGEYTVYTKI